MSNVMATVEKVISTYPIEGADAIEMTQVLDYHVVTKKGEFKANDYVVYAKVDSIFPDGMSEENTTKYGVLKKELTKATSEDEVNRIQLEMAELIKTNTKPDYEFLRGKKFRIKALKYNKFADKFGNAIVSQGIIFGTHVIPSDFIWTEGTDVTEVLGITKVVEDADEVISEGTNDETHSFVKWLDRKFMRYSLYRKIKAELVGKTVKGTWAEWMPPVSDEENIQKRFTRLKAKYGNEGGWIVTEKMEGQSISFYRMTNKKWFGFKTEEHFGVCSRSNHKPRNDGSDFWKTAIRMDIHNKLKKVGKNIFIRGEHCGGKIQENIYKFPEIRVFIYDVWDIDARRKYTHSEMTAFCKEFGFETCPVLNDNFKFPDTVQEMLTYSDGKSVMGDVWREGVVIRRFDDSNESVKAKSPEYELRKGGSKAFPGKPIK